MELGSGQLEWPPVLPTSSVTRGNTRSHVAFLCHRICSWPWDGDDGSAAASEVFGKMPEQPWGPIPYRVVRKGAWRRLSLRGSRAWNGHVQRSCGDMRLRWSTATEMEAIRHASCT